MVAGLLQFVLPIGIGRLYAGHTGIGIAQLLLTVLRHRRDLGVHRRHRHPRRAADRRERSAAPRRVPALTPQLRPSGRRTGSAGPAMGVDRARLAAPVRTACTASSAATQELTICPRTPCATASASGNQCHEVGLLVVGAEVGPADACRPVARNTRTASSVKPGDGATSSSTDHSAAARPTSSASSRPRSPRGLARDVQQAGRQLPEAPPERVPVLVDHHHPVVVVQRGDRDGAGVLDDLADGVPPPGMPTSSTRSASTLPV